MSSLIDGSTPPIVSSADPFDFHILSGAEDFPSLPDAGDIHADPAADDSRDPMPLWPDVPIGTSGMVGPVRRSARGSTAGATLRRPAIDTARSQEPTATAPSGGAPHSAVATPLTLTVSLGNQQELSQNVLRAVARQVREMVVEASGSAARRGVWNYAEQVRVSMGR
jgi:hypothetical protein